MPDFRSGITVLTELGLLVNKLDALVPKKRTRELRAWKKWNNTDKKNKKGEEKKEKKTTRHEKTTRHWCEVDGRWESATPIHPLFCVIVSLLNVFLTILIEPLLARLFTLLCTRSFAFGWPTRHNYSCDPDSVSCDTICRIRAQCDTIHRQTHAFC